LPLGWLQKKAANTPPKSASEKYDFYPTFERHQVEHFPRR